MTKRTRVASQLAAAGWQPGRRVDTTEVEAALSAAGYAVGSMARQIMSEFDGLTLFRDDRPLSIDASDAAGATNPNLTSAYERLIGQSLTPVGYYMLITIYVAADGRFFGGVDGDCGFIGDDFANGRLRSKPKTPEILGLEDPLATR